MPRPRELANPVRMEVWVEREVLEALDRAASSEGVSRSELVRQILSSWASMRPGSDLAARWADGDSGGKTEFRPDRQAPVATRAKIASLKERIREEYAIYGQLVEAIRRRAGDPLSMRMGELEAEIARLKETRMRLLELISRYPLSRDPELERILDSVIHPPEEVEEVIERWRDRRL